MVWIIELLFFHLFFRLLFFIGIFVGYLLIINLYYIILFIIKKYDLIKNNIIIYLNIPNVTYYNYKLFYIILLNKISSIITFFIYNIFFSFFYFHCSKQLYHLYFSFFYYHHYYSKCIH